jgi:RHS repeat-associated protein
MGFSVRRGDAVQPLCISQQYTYDGYGRLTQVHRFVSQNGQLVENTCQEEIYSYDSNPYDSSYSGYYTAGRLTAVQYFFCAPYPVYGGNSTFTDMYNYSQAGGKTGKRLQVTRPAGSGYSTVNLDGSYTYDNEGRMTAEQYPSWDGVAGPNLGYAFDTMGRLNTLTDLTAESAIISGTTYGPSNELLTIGGVVSETRTYNSMLQLLSLVAGAGPTVNLTYAYSSTQNNGKISSQTDNLSGEQVVYTYDALNRLASATATSSSWGQSYSYDGFGNLTGQTVTAGSAPSYSVTPNPSTNHLGGEDANGNTPYSNDANGTNYVMTYDVENRYTGSLTSSGSFAYGYAPSNKRVYRGVANGNNLVTDEVTYWSPAGKKLATYEMVLNGSQWIAVQTETYYWFGGKLIKNGNGYVATDGLGSIGHFYPYGLEKPSATQNGTEKFTGYLRDAETGLDYAKNRYHDPGTGRFMTPDPYIASVGPTDPGSWNRYAYTRGDPVNRVDPRGLNDCTPLSDGSFDCGGVTGTGDSGDGSADDGSDDDSGDNSDVAFQNRTTESHQYLLGLARLTVQNAVARASDVIANPDCASLFLATAFNTPDDRVALSQAFQNYGADDVRVLPQGSSNLPATVPAETTAAYGYTYVVQGGSFFTNTMAGQPLGGAFSGLSTSQTQDVILIHEFMHYLGLVGDDNAGQQYTFANGDTVTGSNGISQEIRTHCLN